MTPRVRPSNSYCIRRVLGSATDAVVACSMPVLQLAEAIDSMKRIKKIGQNAIDAHRKELIPEILAIVLMVIPFVGKALGPLICSATSIARIALLVGEMGNGGPTVAALFAILGLIAGVDSGTGKLSKGRPW
jgi:chitinase